MLREDALQSRVPVGPKTRVVSSQEGNFMFLHVTRLADIIPLRFAVRVRPMQGIFRALLPAAAIPTDSMTGAKLHVWHHTQEVMQGKEPRCRDAILG